MAVGLTQPLTEKSTRKSQSEISVLKYEEQLLVFRDGYLSPHLTAFGCLTDTFVGFMAFGSAFLVGQDVTELSRSLGCLWGCQDSIPCDACMIRAARGGSRPGFSPITSILLWQRSV
jgi:hypothetical protein